LRIIPVNKQDSRWASGTPRGVAEQAKHILGVDDGEVLRVSAKDGNRVSAKSWDAIGG